MTRAPLSTAQRIGASLRLDRDRARLRHHLRDQELRRRGEAGDPHAVVDARTDEPGDERPVPERVGAGLPADEALRVEDLPCEVGMRRIDAGVDHRDGDRLERREGEPRRVEAAVGEVPLLRGERVGRRERQLAGHERLDVANPVDPAERDTGGEVENEGRDRLQALRTRSRAALDRPRDGAVIRAVRQSHRDTSGVRGSGQREPRRSDCEDCRDPSHADTCTTAEVPAASPSVADIRAR